MSSRALDFSTACPDMISLSCSLGEGMTCHPRSLSYCLPLPHPLRPAKSTSEIDLRSFSSYPSVQPLTWCWLFPLLRGSPDWPSWTQSRSPSSLHFQSHLSSPNVTRSLLSPFHQNKGQSLTPPTRAFTIWPLCPALASTHSPNLGQVLGKRHQFWAGAQILLSFLSRFSSSKMSGVD